MSILTIPQIPKEIEKLQNKNKSIVLVGGCFDIIHLGHIRFLQKAKEQADILIVLLESDEKIKKLKGETRPLHTQTERAEILANIRSVDYIILLPDQTTNQTYEDLVKKIKPAIIAATQNDPGRIYKERQAEQIGAKVAYVIDYIPNKSTSTIVKNIYNEDL